MKYLYSPPTIIKKFFKDFLWNTANNKILLTFDDGPTSEATELILTTLSKNKTKAVFFCVGNNVKNHNALVKEILIEGHLIANHTFNHKKFNEISKRETNEEVNSFNNIMKEEFDYDIKYFRPPHGKFKISTNGILKEKKMKCVMWSLLTQDYKNDFETVKFAVRNYLRKNSIIVLHDSIKSRKIIKDSINFIIDEAAKKEFSFGEPTECLR